MVSSFYFSFFLFFYTTYKLVSLCGKLCLSSENSSGNENRSSSGVAVFQGNRNCNARFIFISTNSSQGIWNIFIFGPRLEVTHSSIITWESFLLVLGKINAGNEFYDGTWSSCFVYQFTWEIQTARNIASRSCQWNIYLIICICSSKLWICKEILCLSCYSGHLQAAYLASQSNNKTTQRSNMLMVRCFHSFLFIYVEIVVIWRT